MKKYIYCLLCLLTGLFFNAKAEIVLSGEEQMKVLPKIFHKKYPPFRPPNEDCHFIGKRVTAWRDKGDLWFIANSCAGSGGAQMSIALVSGNRVTELLYTGAESSMTILDSSHAGYPDLQVDGGMAATGGHTYTFRYNGKSYVKAESYVDMLLPSQANWAELPAPSREFFMQYTRTNNCIQRELKASEELKGYDLAGNETGTPVYIVTSACPENRKMPVWAIADTSQPHIIFHTTTTNADEEPTLRIGPGSAHGLSDICILNDKDKPSERCWRYDGATYRPKAP